MHHYNPPQKNSDTRHNQYQPQKNSNTRHNQYHSNNLPMDCFLRPSGTVTGAEDDDSSCLTSGVVFSEKSSGVDSFGAMMVSETSPVEVDIVLELGTQVKIRKLHKLWSSGVAGWERE